MRNNNGRGKNQAASAERSPRKFALWSAWFLMGGLAIAVSFRPALAQSPPPSGQILRDIEGAPDLKPDTLNTLEDSPVEIPAAPLLSGDRLTSEVLDVKAYRITGNTVFTEQALLALIAHRTGGRTLAELEQTAQIITEYYGKRGYIAARAHVPQQEVRDGVITIAVVEGRYEKISITNDSDLSDRRVRLTLEEAICGSGKDCDGDLIERAGLERGLLLLSDMPGTAVQAELKPGSQTGTSIFEANVTRTRGWLAALQTNNYGSRFTGKTRVTGTFGLNNPGGFGDQLMVQAMGAEDTIYARIRYSIPMGYQGTRLSIHGSRLDYSLGGTFEALDAHGEAYTIGADLSHPFVRSTTANLIGQVSYNLHILRDEIDAQSISNRRTLHEASVRLTGDKADTFFGSRAVTSGSASFTAGQLDFEDQASAGIDAATADTAGTFYKVNLSISRYQTVAPGLALYGRLEGQYGLDNLDAFAKLSLGGPGYVRAHPVGEASGDRAYLGVAELRWSPGKIFGVTAEFKGFYDYGVAYLNARPWVAGDNKRTLQGPGVGLGIDHPGGATLNVTAAFRSGEKSQSEPDRAYRIWFSAGYRF